MLLKLVSSFIQFPSISYSFFCNSEPKEHEEPESIAFKKAISNVSNESDHSLRNFIRILEKCITTVSKRYRENILQQIAVLTQNDPLLLEADEFLKLQEESDELKTHLNDYKLLAENSGKMAYNQAVSALHCGSSDPGQIVCQVYCAFEKMYTSEYKLNDEYERNLNWMSETLNKTVDTKWKLDSKKQHHMTAPL